MIKPIQQHKQISYKSVSPKFLKMAQEEHKIMNTISGDLIEKLQFDILTKRLSSQDGIDTINELRKYTKKKYQNLLDTCIEMCESITHRNSHSKM